MKRMEYHRRKSCKNQNGRDLRRGRYAISRDSRAESRPQQRAAEKLGTEHVLATTAHVRRGVVNGKRDQSHDVRNQNEFYAYTCIEICNVLCVYVCDVCVQSVVQFALRALCPPHVSVLAKRGGGAWRRKVVAPLSYFRAGEIAARTANSYETVMADHVTRASKRKVPDDEVVGRGGEGGRGSATKRVLCNKKIPRPPPSSRRFFLPSLRVSRSHIVPSVSVTKTFWRY